MKKFLIFWVWLTFACLVFMAQVGGVIEWPWWVVWLISLSPFAFALVVLFIIWFIGRRTGGH